MPHLPKAFVHYPVPLKLPGTATSTELLFLLENCSLSEVVFALTASQLGQLNQSP